MIKSLFRRNKKQELEKWLVLPVGEAAFKSLTNKAEAGNSEAQAILSLLYLNGFGLDQNIGRAFELIEKASSDVYALNMCYKAGVERKEPGAHFGQFAMWKNGWGVPKNNELAIKHLKVAAELGFPRAMMVLGLEYQSGFSGVKRDIGRAEKWLWKAVNAGEDAYSHLHHIYYKEEGYIDYERAFDCIVEASKSGWPACFSHLAKMYENGEGVKKDLISAAKYYYLASCQGKPKAKPERSGLVRVCSELDTEEKEKVRQLALKWIEEHGHSAEQFNAFNEELSDPMKFYGVQ